MNSLPPHPVPRKPEPPRPLTARLPWHHNPGTRQDQDLPRGLNPAQHPIICRHFYDLEVQEAERAA